MQEQTADQRVLALFHYIETHNMQAIVGLVSQFPNLVNATNEDENTPLHLAASDNQLELLEFYLKFTDTNPDIPGCSARTPLHCASFEGHLECVKLLFSFGANMGWMDALDESCIHKAARKGQYYVLQYLLSRKPSRAVLNQQNVVGCTALHQAMERGNEDCSRVLLDAGCDPNILDFFGIPPVFVPKPKPREWTYQY